jgi:hypothetical protein
LKELIEHAITFAYSIGINGILFLTLGVVGKSLFVGFLNMINRKKIFDEIHKNSEILKIVQESETNRVLLDADRILVTQLHNGGVFRSGQSMIKLSLYQNLSIDNPYGHPRHKIFDKQLDNILINRLAPILKNVSDSKKKYDIISVLDLPRDFEFNRHLKIDHINYIILTKIEYSNILIGYMFVIFCKDTIPAHDKKIVNNLINLGNKLGKILK